MDEKRVPPRLLQHALSRINQDHRKISGRCAGHHIAGILFVPRRIGDDELALFGGEEAVGDVNRNALFTLCRKTINQQREVNLFALGAVAFAVAFERGKLIFEDHLGIIQQTPDQGGLAIIHAAAGDKPQQALVLMRSEIGVDILRNQGIGLEAWGGGLIGHNSKSVRAEPVEALHFLVLGIRKKGQPFDKLRANGAWQTPDQVRG